MFSSIKYWIKVSWSVSLLMLLMLWVHIERVFSFLWGFLLGPNIFSSEVFVGPGFRVAVFVSLVGCVGWKCWWWKVWTCSSKNCWIRFSSWDVVWESGVFLVGVVGCVEVWMSGDGDVFGRRFCRYLWISGNLFILGSVRVSLMSLKGSSMELTVDWSSVSLFVIASGEKERGLSSKLLCDWVGLP